MSSRRSIKALVYTKKPISFRRNKDARSTTVSAARKQYRYQSRNELKYFDTTLSFNFDATPEVPATGQLVLIPQGVTDTTRVGRKCTIKSIQLRGTVLFAPAAAAAAASTNVYMYLVLDKQTNGAAAGYTDVMLGANIATGFTNLTNQDRFVILKRLKWNLTSQAGATTGFANIAKSFDYYTKCNYNIEYSSTTGAIGEIRSNNLFLLAGSDGQSDDTVSMSGQCRVRFDD